MIIAVLVAMAPLCVAIAGNAQQSSDNECSFTVVPVHACVISFYKLIANPNKYDRKYISIIGYIAISNGRLAVYPTEMSYKLSIEQESVTIGAKESKLQRIAKDFDRNYVRIVGMYHYSVTGNYFRPGIGTVSKIIGIDRVVERPDLPQNHTLKFDVQKKGSSVPDGKTEPP